MESLLGVVLGKGRQGDAVVGVVLNKRRQGDAVVGVVNVAWLLDGLPICCCCLGQFPGLLVVCLDGKNRGRE